MVERLARLCLWESWPPALQALYHSIYPAYMVLKSANRLSSADDPVARRFVGLLAAASVAACLHASSRRPLR